LITFLSSERGPPILWSASLDVLLDSCFRIAWDSHAVDVQSAASLLFYRTHARVFVVAGPFLILWAGDQSGLPRVHVNVLDLLIVFFHRAQGTVEKSRLPKLALRSSAPIDGAHRTLLHRLHSRANRHRVHRCANGVPMIEKKNPGGQIKAVQRSASVESPRQEREISVAQFFATFEQPNRDEEIPIRKKGTPELGHGAGIRRWDNDCQKRRGPQDRWSALLADVICET